MEAIKIEVTGNIAKVIEKPLRITSGTVGLPVEFVFDSHWDNMTKVAVFNTGIVKKNMKIVGDATVVPIEALSVPALNLSIGVYGVSEDGAVATPTVWASVGQIRHGAVPASSFGSDIGTAKKYYDLGEQAAEKADASAKKAESGAKSAADSAELAGKEAEYAITECTQLKNESFNAKYNAEDAATRAEESAERAEAAADRAGSSADAKPKDLIVTATFDTVISDTITNGTASVSAYDIAEAVSAGATVKLIDNDDIVYEYVGHRLQPNYNNAIFEAVDFGEDGYTTYRVTVNIEGQASRTSYFTEFGSGDGSDENAVIVTIVENTDGSLTASKNSSEIFEYAEQGYVVYLDDFEYTGEASGGGFHTLIHSSIDMAHFVRCSVLYPGFDHYYLVDVDGAVEIVKEADSSSNAVRYTHQELSEEQKAQARENIGALGEADINSTSTTTASGEVIRIDDVLAADAKMRIKVNGVADPANCIVSVYGRNLFPYPYVNTSFENRRGVTLADNGDGTLTINGTAEGSPVYFNFRMLDSSPIHLRKGKYTFKMVEEVHPALQVTLAFSSPNATAKGNTITLGGASQQIEIIEDTDCAATMSILVDKAINNVVLRPQIEWGEVATDFVPYQVPAEYSPDANGEVAEALMAYPTTTIFANDESATLEVSYGANGDKALDEMREEIRAIEAEVEAIKSANEYVVGTPVVIDNFQSLNGWIAAGHLSGIYSVQADTENFIYGTQSINFVGSMQKNNLGIKVDGREFRVKFKVNSIESGARLLMYVSDSSSFANVVSWVLYDNTISTEALRTNSSVKVGEWTELVLPWAAVQNTEGIERLATINSIKFQFLSANGNANIQLLTSEPKKEPKGVLSITFDDGCKAIYTKAAKALGARGLKATAYIIPEIVGVSDGCVTEEELISLKYDYGWDIEGHWGEAMGDYSEEQLVTSFESVKTYMKEHGLGDCEHFAYASGVYDGNVEKVARRYFKTARTIAGLNVRGIASTKLTNPYRLISCSGVSDTSAPGPFEHILNRITDISEHGGWLILTFHDIGDTATGMFCSEEGFARLLDHAISCGVEIKTVEEAMRCNV